MNKRLQKLLGERQTTVAKMKAMLDVADTESRELSADESTDYAALEASIATLDTKIGREQKLADAERTAPAVASAAGASVIVREVHARSADQPFASLGEQLVAIAEVGMGTASGETVERLAGPSGASANVGSDGGFLIQKDFATDLTGSGIDTGVLSSRCSVTEIGANSDGLEVVVIKETSRANGSRWGGVQVYRRAEADTVNATKPGFDKWESRLEDMMGLAYATDRLLQDASALGSVFQEAFNSEFGFKLDDEIFSGTGVGQCVGFQNADALVTVPAEGAQVAATVVALNVINMWARMPLRNRLNAVWLYNIEAEPQLMTMTIGTGAGIIPVWMPPGGISGQAYATIFGRPALPIEHASALGTVGDLSLVDFTQYKLIRKGGVQADESIHVRFIYGERAFRWITRVNGAPKWKSALTPYKGANKLSPFITLAAR